LVYCSFQLYFDFVLGKGKLESIQVQLNNVSGNTSSSSLSIADALMTNLTQTFNRVNDNVFGLFGSESIVITSALITVIVLLFWYNAYSTAEPYLRRAKELGKSYE
jgi:type IV secretory pathway TrbL component